MMRRVVALVLIVAAALPLAYGARLLGDDLVRACAILVVSLVGVGAALPALIGSKVQVVPWLRLLAIVLSGVVFAAMLAAWYFLDQIAVPDLERRLPQVPEAALVERSELRAQLQAYRTFAERLLRLAGAVLICGCSIATLPGARAAADADTTPPSHGE